MSELTKTVYSGQCHCGAVKFIVRSDKHLVAWDCNCSICIMKKNTHFVVPHAQFVLLPQVPPEDRLNADEAHAAAKEDSAYPAHWGQPPKMQTRDRRELPGNYGFGSSTLANWIQGKMDIDSGPSLVDEDAHGCLSTYTYNTHTAKHIFCSNCGVQCFYRPRSNPDGIGITLNCLIPLVALADAGSLGDASTSEIRTFDGQNWESYIEKSGIRAFSKDKIKL